MDKGQLKRRLKKIGNECEELMSDFDLLAQEPNRRDVEELESYAQLLDTVKDRIDEILEENRK
jgi:sugar-specific transcriptional regulator TrmB